MNDLKKILKDLRNFKTLLKSTFLTMEIKNMLSKSENYIIDIPEEDEDSDKSEENCYKMSLTSNTTNDLKVLE